MNEAELIEANKILEQKNKSLEGALDKAHSDQFRAEEIASDLKAQLDEKKHSEQLGGWAIDRAIEFAKVLPEGNKPLTVAGLITMAGGICDGVKEIASSDRQPATTH